MPRKPDPRIFAVLLGLLGLAAAVAPAALSPARASILPATARDGPTCPSPPAPSGAPQENRPASAGPHGALPARPIGYLETRAGHVVRTDGTGDVFGGGHHDDDEGAATRARASAGPLHRLSTNVPATLAPAASGDCRRPESSPNATGGVDAGTALPWISADPGQPLVATTPSKLTGSTLTMTGLRLEGIVQLPTADGTLTALKFSMHEAVTDDVALRPAGAPDRTVRFTADRLTVSGNVAFYATRFVGGLPGVKITLAPDRPLPVGVPILSPAAITVTDPAIDLAFVKSDTLSAR
ncbi:hypothetical protein ACVCAH_30135 [Micromonospora sp. LZ34]